MDRIEMSRIQVAVVTKSLTGGAGRAAERIVKSVKKVDAEVDFDFFLALKPFGGTSRTWSSYSHPNWKNFISWVRIFFPVQLSRLVSRKVFRSEQKALVSLAWKKTGLATHVNQTSPGLTHIHWLGDNVMSVEEVRDLASPVIWTLHDMWPISGAEHYTSSSRHHSEMNRLNRSDHEKGPDLNKWVWGRKIASWNRPLTLVSPSDWLAEEALRSSVAPKKTVCTIPNPIDTEFWQRDESLGKSLRSDLGINSSEKLLIFGLVPGRSDFLKGLDLVEPTLVSLVELMSQKRHDFKIKVIGFGVSGASKQIGPIELTFVGNASDNQLRALYSAADLTLVPSRLDNWPSVAIESISCGTPIATFDTSGPAEIVRKSGAGIIASGFSTADLAIKILAFLSEPSAAQRVSIMGRIFAVEHWSEEVVGRQYADLYRSLT